MFILNTTTAILLSLLYCRFSQTDAAVSHYSSDGDIFICKLRRTMYCIIVNHIVEGSVFAIGIFLLLVLLLLSLYTFERRCVCVHNRTNFNYEIWKRGILSRFRLICLSEFIADVDVFVVFSCIRMKQMTESRVFFPGVRRLVHTHSYLNSHNIIIVEPEKAGFFSRSVYTHQHLQTD